MAQCDIKTDVYFGFATAGLSPGEQRFGGFGVGRWATPEEIRFISEQRRSPVSRPTKLAKHEADISLAARALHSVVLTLDQGSVALKNAKAQGGKVVYLNAFEKPRWECRAPVCAGNCWRSKLVIRGARLITKRRDRTRLPRSPLVGRHVEAGVCPNLGQRKAARSRRRSSGFSGVMPGKQHTISRKLI
jgi:hypothetical protein